MCSPYAKNVLVIPIEMDSLGRGRRIVNHHHINSINNNDDDEPGQPAQLKSHPPPANIPPHFRLLFLTTGLYFEGERRPLWRQIRLFFVFFFLGLNLYRLGTFVTFLFTTGNSKVLSAHILVLNIKALTAQVFFCFWQYGGHFSNLLATIIGPQFDRGRRRIFWQTLAICMAMFGLQIGAEAMNFVLKQTGQLDYEDRREAMRKVGLGAWKHVFFLVTNWWHAQFVMAIITVLFNVLIRLVVRELDTINSQLKEKSLDDEKLIAFCEHFLAIVKNVRAIDRAFEAYLLLMLGTNIPATLFTLIRLFRQFKSWCWLQFAILLPDLLSCIFELVSLTVMPSILHSRLLAVPTNLIEQTRVNELLDNNPHNHIRYLVSRITIHSPLGISLWGFTTITKPLMLSVLSMMATYLTIVMQIFTN